WGVSVEAPLRRNHDSNDRAGSWRTLQLETATQLSRTIAHGVQPQPTFMVESAWIESDPVVRHDERHIVAGSSHPNAQSVLSRMLHRVSKGFLHDAEQRECGGARYDAGAFFGVACDRNPAGGAQLFAVVLDGLRQPSLMQERCV